MKASHAKLKRLVVLLALCGAAVMPQSFQRASLAASGPEVPGAIALDTTKPANEVTAPAEGWSFRNHVIPVLTRLGCNSGACHGSASGKNGFKLTLRGFDPEMDFNVLSRQSLGRRINQIEPARSLLLLKPTMAVGHAGGELMKVDSLEYRVIAEWIAGGMKPPSESDAKIERIEVTPREVTLAKGAEAQMRVKAFFNDGRVEDVTKWTRYGSTDIGVATVDEDGKVKIAGSGVAAITAIYMNQTGLARFANPHANAISAEVFARSPRQNFIDEHVIAKLKQLRIAPSGQATNREFVRRAFIDATGMLPTPAETEKFLADSAPDKRARLIDSLLAREAYADYWTNRWAEVFLISSAKLSGGEVWSFYNWLRGAVRENKPWNQVATEIITAKGSTLDNGAAGFFVMHKEPSDLVENFSMAFMGLSITCARCHNHPLEKWSQKQYYGMANLFGRVGMKNGERPGDIIVYDKRAGDVSHPRLGKPVNPAPLDGEELALDSTKDRRAHMAAWLTAPTNPYFARVTVNRVWKNFMGRGLVEAVDDLRATNPPSNEALMNALTDDFIKSGYDIKHLIRTIMNSAAYQRSSQSLEANREDEKYYSRYVIRRMNAETYLDAVSQATAAPTEFPGYATGTRAAQLPDAKVASYFLRVFGRPDRVNTCECERSSVSTVAQSLHVINGDTLNQKLRAPGGLVEQLAKLPDEEAVDRLFATALSRPPTEKERAGLLAALKESASERRQGLEDAVWSVVTSREFQFNH